MRVIIAGSRDITSYEIVETAIKMSGFNITTVVSGGARGVDSLAELWAYKNRIKSDVYLANWKPAHLNGRTDKSAGYKRNLLMSTKADALIAIWDGKSKGTKHMIDIANKKGLRVFVYENPCLLVEIPK